MYLKLLLPAAALAACTGIKAQGLKIQPGTTFKTTPGISIVVQNGNLTNAGNGDFAASNLYMSGGAQGRLYGPGTLSFTNLYINKPSSSAILSNNISVSNSIVFQAGILNLTSYVVTLAPTAQLVGESESSHIFTTSTGYITITVDLKAPLGVNPGNLGAIIASTQNLGSTTIKRGHAVQQNNGSGTSIKRYYKITPANNASLNAIFRFTYFNAELNGLSEASLTMWRSTNGGTSYTNRGADGSDASLNYVDISNENSFQQYTLSSPTFSFAKTTAVDAIPNADMLKISSVGLAPNPVGNEGKVTIHAGVASNAIVSIFAADGRRVMQQQAYLYQGANQQTINVSSLAKGIYYLTVQLGDGTKKTIPFIKQ